MAERKSRPARPEPPPGFGLRRRSLRSRRFGWNRRWRERPPNMAVGKRCRPFARPPPHSKRFAHSGARGVLDDARSRARTARGGRGFSRQAGPLGGRLIVFVPIELPEAFDFHLFTVAIEERHVDRARQVLVRRLLARIEF